MQGKRGLFGSGSKVMKRDRSFADTPISMAALLEHWRHVTGFGASEFLQRFLITNTIACFLLASLYPFPSYFHHNTSWPIHGLSLVPYETNNLKQSSERAGASPHVRRGDVERRGGGLFLHSRWLQRKSTQVSVLPVVAHNSPGAWVPTLLCQYGAMWLHAWARNIPCDLCAASTFTSTLCDANKLNPRAAGTGLREAARFLRRSKPTKGRCTRSTSTPLRMAPAPALLPAAATERSRLGIQR